MKKFHYNIFQVLEYKGPNPKRQILDTINDMSNEKITVRAPQIFLDSNLEFPNTEKTVTEVTVTRGRCIDPTLIDSFLRLLRHGSDDVIRQKINNITKQGSMLHSRSDKCNGFVRDELYPNWKERTRAITFCQRQAELMKLELDQQYNGADSEPSRPKVDQRIDPYAERDRIAEQEVHYQQWKQLNRWVDNNLQIESILRATSDEILKGKCDQNEEYLKIFFKYMNDNKN